ncbi:MAG: TrkA family potassium uptake protein [Ignavibacteriaceae bacterium]
MTQFVVMGLGNFGHNVAVALVEKGNEVLAIDIDSKKVEQIKEYVTEAVTADVRDKAVLSELINKNVTGVIVSLGDSLEASSLATLYLRELGVTNIIVKVVEDIHGTILKKIGAAEIINPEKDSAKRLAEKLNTPNLIEHIPLAPEYSIVEFVVPDKFSGQTLNELQLRNKYNIDVIAVKDVLLDKFNLIPNPNYKLQPDNILIIIGKKENLAKLKL